MVGRKGDKCFSCQMNHEVTYGVWPKFIYQLKKCESNANRLVSDGIIVST